MDTYIYLVRHAHAGHNAAADRDGDSAYHDPVQKDAPLTPKGHAQLEGLPQLDIQMIQTSPLRRTIETAKALAAACNYHSQIVADDQLLETMGGGHICNERPSETLWLQENHDIPFKSRYSDQAIMEMTGKERETPKQVRNRAQFFFHELLHKLHKLEEKGEVVEGVAVVTHHDFIFAITGQTTKNTEVIPMTMAEILQLLKQGTPTKFDQLKIEQGNHVVKSA